MKSRAVPMINLQPGALHLAKEPSILHTVLGSCVSVTFWSKRLGVGAMCHGVLPRCPTSLTAKCNDIAEGGRYVDFSIRYLAEQFDALGAGRQHVEVKVFGGADVLPGNIQPGRFTVGAQNCQSALEVLAQEGFLIAASNIGGEFGRTIDFHTATGQVLMRRLDSLASFSTLEKVR